MLQYLPKWILRRAKILWNSFESKKFTFVEAEKVLNDDDSRMVAVILSELKRAGWLNTASDTDNPRKKLYSFKHLDTMKELVKIEVGD